MALVAAKCTQCGSNIEVDASKDAGICVHCGTAFVTEKVITNTYNTNYTVNNIQTDKVIISDKNIENLKILAENAYENDNFDKAYYYFTKALEINPMDKELQYKQFAVKILSGDNNENDYKILKKYIIEIFEASLKGFFLNSTEIVLELLNALHKDTNNYVDSINEMQRKFEVGGSLEFLKTTQTKFFQLYEIYQLIYEKTKSDSSMQNCFVNVCERKIFPENIMDTPIYYRNFENLKLIMFVWDEELINNIDLFNNCAYKTLLEKKPDSKALAKYNRKIKAPTNEKGACYIATTVYGSYDCREVWVLRRYRDNTLSKKILGKIFIKIYYSLSPKFIKLFGKAKWFHKFWRKKLDKKVDALKKKGFDDTNYYD